MLLATRVVPWDWQTTTIPLVGLPVIAAVSVLLAVLRRQSLAGLPGIVSGLGLPVLYVAYLNRAGTGFFCTRTGRGFTCAQHPSPWPWLIIGLVLVVLGLVGFLGRMVLGPMAGVGLPPASRTADYAA